MGFSNVAVRIREILLVWRINASWSRSLSQPAHPVSRVLPRKRKETPFQWIYQTRPNSSEREGH